LKCITTFGKFRQNKRVSLKRKQKALIKHSDQPFRRSRPDLPKAGNSSGCSEIGSYACTGLTKESELHLPGTVTGQCTGQHPACQEESPISRPLAFRTKLTDTTGKQANFIGGKHQYSRETLYLLCWLEF